MNKKIALVTGAAKGIGLSTSQALIAAGRFVVMVDRLPIDLEQLGIADDQAIAFQADVTDMAFMTRLHAQIKERFGKVSILVNNAGISPKRADGLSNGILDVTIQEWSKVLLVNLTTVMQITQLFLPDMKAQGFGRIVSVSSLAGRSKSVVAGPSYMASKAGILGLMRAIASEMGPFGITANCVAPGRILTEMAMQAGEAVNQRYAEQIPVRRLGTADEVGASIAFLCADSSGFINGATIDINGGFFMS
jgi:3-oxoacyl-[acyl-carrier protein] reductase